MTRTLVTSQRRKTTDVEVLTTVFMCKNVVLNAEPRIVRAHLENGFEITILPFT